MAKGQDPEEDVPFGFYKLVTIAPWFFATFMPVVCILLLVLGFFEYEVNDQISDIWKESAGQFYEDEQYRYKSEAIDGGASTMLAIAKERNNGNLFTAGKLGSVIARMADLEANATVIVDGNNYTFEDICALYDSDEHYSAPCVRITSMDMWKEAGYAWDASYATPGRAMQKWWFKEAVLGNLVGAVEMFATASGLFPCPFALTAQQCAALPAPTNGLCAICAPVAALSGPIASCAAPGMPLDPTTYPSQIAQLSAFLTLDGCSQCYQDVVAVIEASSVARAAAYSGQFSLAMGQQVTFTPDHVKDGLLVNTIRYLASGLSMAALSGAAFGINLNAAADPNFAGLLTSLGFDTTTKKINPYDIIDDKNNWVGSLIAATGGSASAFAALAAFGGGVDLQPVLTCTGSCDPVGIHVDLSTGASTPYTSDQVAQGLGAIQGGLASPTAYPWFSADPLANGYAFYTYATYCAECVLPTTGLPLGYAGNDTSNSACLASNDFGHLDTTTGQPTTLPCVALMDNAKWFTAVLAGYDTTSTAGGDGTARGYYNWAVDFLSNFAANGGTSPNPDLGRAFSSTTGDPYKIQIGQNLLPAYTKGRMSFTNKNEAEVLKYGSGNIYAIDEGVSLGNVSKFITMGGTDPPIGQYSCNNYSSQAGVIGKAWAGTCDAPLQKVEGVQALYIIVRPKYIMQRVANSSRPGGALVITEDTAKKVMKEFKTVLEKRWTDGNPDIPLADRGTWDDSSTDVEFLAFFDDAGEPGSFSRALDDVTNSGIPLTGISYGVLFLVSVLLLLHCSDRQHSRVVAGAFGTIFSIIAFLGAIGITALMGKQLQIVQMWTLPFLMVGIGVDDMYIITLALNKSQSMSARRFVETMNETAVPVTMTSLTNLGMFAIMTMVTIPATYETAYTAMYAIGLLYLTMLTAYPAVMYLDLKRQEGTCVVSCLNDCKAYEPPDKPNMAQGMVYTMLYKPVLGSKIFHAVVLFISVGLVGVSAYACTDFDIGIGIKEFAQEGTQLRAWAEAAESTFPVWPMSMSWGDVDYRDPKTQLHIVKQFEGVLDTAHVDFQKDTDNDLWMGSLQIWGSKVCDNGVGEVCGADFTIPPSVTDNTGRTCTTTWIKTTGNFAAYNGNKMADFKIDYGSGLTGQRQYMYTGSGNATTTVGLDTAPGVCVTGRRLGGQMTMPVPATGSCVSGTVPAEDYDSNFCPVFAHSTSGVCTDGVCADVAPYTWQELQFCMGKWRQQESGGSYNYESYAADGITRTSDEPQICDGAGFPDFTCRAGDTPTGIKVTTSSTMFAINLTSHDKYVNMIEDARAVCDDDDTAPWHSDSSVEAGCWVRGIPVDYWTQYLGIEMFLLKICGYAILAGVVVSQTFMLGDLLCGSNSISTKSCASKWLASWIGGLLIGLVCAMSLVTVIGLSTLLGVNLTVFSIMSYMMSVGYAVEYSVHIVHRFMTAPVEAERPLERAEFAMDFLFMPCFMAFVSSTIGIIVMAFSELTFVRKFFFTPLFICMLVTYWYGIFFLPVFLQYIGFQCMHVGPSASDSKRASIQAYANNGVVVNKGGL